MHDIFSFLTTAHVILMADPNWIMLTPYDSIRTAENITVQFLYSGRNFQLYKELLRQWVRCKVVMDPI